LGSWDQEDHCSRLALANNLQDPISKNRATRAKKWARVVAQEVQHLLCKHQAQHSNPSSTKKKKKIILLF
jgi:hypothetical protein